MTHDIPSEGRPSAVTGQPETPVASRVDERACSRPAAAAPGAAEGKSAAPGISPADHPLGVETPEQAARYWQMRHAEAHIELAKGTRRILELQNEVAALSKRHAEAAAGFTKEVEGIRFHLDRIGVPTHRDGQALTLPQRIDGLLEPATAERLRVAAVDEVERLKASLAEEKRERAKWGSEARTAMATLRECHELIDKAAIPRLEHTRMLSLQDRIRFLLERAAKPVHVAPPPAVAEVERLKADLAEEKRERARWESDARAARAMLIQCHELIDKAAIPSVMLGRMQGLQGCIRALLELAAKPVHVVPPPADTASCEQHLQERIEELEADLKAARADLSAARRYCEGIEAERIAHLRTINDVHAMLDRLHIGRVGICSPRSLSERVYSLHERSQHPAIDSIHAALDRAGVPRVEAAEMPPRTRPMTPQSRIEDLAKHRDRLRAEVSRLEGNLKVTQQTTEELIAIGVGAAKRANANADLLAWLDKVGDLVVLNLRVGPVCVKCGATGSHKTLRDALEAIRASELESVLRREAVK